MTDQTREEIERAIDAYDSDAHHAVRYTVEQAREHVAEIIAEVA